MANEELEKALGGAGEGGEFVWEAFPKEFVARVTERNWCRQFFQVVNMPVDVMRIPRITGDASVYRVTDGTTPAAESTISTNEMVLNVEKLMAYFNVNVELTEDARLAMIPIIKESAFNAMANAEEEAFINGDSTGPATDHKTICDGLVKLAKQANSGNAEVDVGGAPLALSHINQARFNIGRYGRDVSQLVLIVNPYTGVELRGLPEVVTVDKYGPKATAVTGELGKIAGVTVVESAYVPFGTAANQGQAVLVYQPSPIIGDRRKVTIRQEEVILSDQIRIVISERVDFQVRYSSGISLIKNLRNGL